MPYKKGGGNHLQYYDQKDGEYDDATLEEINKKDKENITMVYYFGLKYGDLTFHWPTVKVHDDEYCSIFVRYAREQISNYDISNQKINYLLKFDKNKDKSKFLESLGYNHDNENDLIKDIYNYTDELSLTYSSYDNGCLKCIAKTNLRGKIVTTVWELQKGFVLRLITLIPGGDKIWK